MKFPSDVSAHQLVRTLERPGHHKVRQRGSHIRLRHDGPPAHSVSIPDHNPIKKGTLHGILTEVARARSSLLEGILDLL